MVKLRINVTREILEKSKYCGTSVDNFKARSTSCAIALAIRDVFPHSAVSGYDIYCCSGELRGYIALAKLPPEARHFIIDFDRKTPRERLQMDPISFEIEIPDAVLETIDIQEVEKILQDHPTMSLVK